jgi:hypothetical protein
MLKYWSMNVYGKIKAKFYALISLVSDGYEWPVHTPAVLFPTKEPPILISQVGGSPSVPGDIKQSLSLLGIESWLSSHSQSLHTLIIFSEL